MMSEVKILSNAFFLGSFLGFFTLITIYSIVVTGFKTVNVIALPVLVYLFYSNSKKFELSSYNYKTLLHLLYIFPITYFIYGCFLLPTSIENDVRYYAKISFALAEFGQENVYHFYNKFDKGFWGIMPYHYTEMWLTSFFNVIFKVKSIIALKYMTYPFFISSLGYGVFGIVKRTSFFTFILFLGLSALPFFHISVFGSGFPVYTDFWIRPNFIIYYYVLLALFLLIIEKNWNLLFLFVIICGTASVIILPCLYGGLFIFSTVLMFRKDIKVQKFVFLNASLLLFFILLITLNGIFSPALSLYSGLSFPEIIAYSLSIWKAVVFSIVTIIIECGMLLLVGYLLNRYLVKEDALNFIYLFILIQVVIGVVLFQMLNQLDNAYQFPYFPFAATGFILILSIIMVLDSHSFVRLRTSLIALLIVFCCFTSYKNFNFSKFDMSLEDKNLFREKVSKDWVRNTRKYFEANPEALGGFVVTKADLKNFPPNTRNCLTYQWGSFLSYITDNCNLPDLTHTDTLLADKNETNAGLFTKAETWMNVFPKYTHRSSAISFLDEGELDYFISFKNLPIPDSGFFRIEDSKTELVLIGKN